MIPQRARVRQYQSFMSIGGIRPAVWTDISSQGDRIINTTPNPDTVSLAKNKAGTGGSQGSDATQGTGANQPEIGTANNKDVLDFKGNDALGINYTYGTEATWFLVTEKDTTEQYIMSGFGGAAGTPAFFTQFNPGTGIKDFEFHLNDGLTNYREIIQTSAIAGLHVLAASHQDSGRVKGYFDGVQQFDISAAAVTLSGLNFFFLGGFVTTGGYTGRVPLLVIYPKVLDTINVLKLSQTLKNKWNTP